MLTVTKPLDLEALQQELAAAGVAVPRALTLSGAAEDGTRRLYTYDAAGQPADLPAAAAPVVAAHNAATTPAAVQAAADATSLSDFRAAYATALGWLGWNAGTQTWAAAAGQWDALTPAQRTTFMRRLLLALNVLARRAGG